MISRKRKFGWAVPVMGCVLIASICLSEPPPPPRSNRDDLIRAGRTALVDGLYEIAILRFNEVLEEGYEHDGINEVIDALLAGYHGAGRTDRIEELLASRIAQYLGEDGVVWWRAMLSFHAGHAAETIDLLRPIIESDKPGVFAARSYRLAGWAQERLGNSDDAVSLFRRYDEQVEKQRDAHPEAWADNLLDLGRVLRTAGHMDSAISVLKGLMESSPDDYRRVRARYELGRSQVLDRRLVAAVVTLRPLVNDTTLPVDFRILAGLELAIALTAVEGVETAISMLEEFLELPMQDTTHASLKWVLGDCYIAAGRINEGISLLQAFVSAFTRDPRAPMTQLRIGRVWLSVEEWDRAEEAFQRYLNVFEAQRGGMDVAYEGRGVALAELKRYSEASDLFIRASEITQDKYVKEKALLQAAESLFKGERYARAQALFERLLELPDKQIADADVSMRIADCLIARGQHDEAVTLLESVIHSAERPHVIEALLRRAALEGARKDWHEAEASYASILNIASEPSNMAAGLYGRGMARYHLWKPEAADDFKSLRERFPDSPYAEKALYMAAVIQFRLGRDEESLSAAQSFLNAFPESTYSPLIRFWMAEIQYNRRDYANAEALFLAFAGQYPDHTQVGEALYRAGLAAFRKNEFLRANAHFGQLISSLPGNERIPDARYAQADSLIQLGRFAEAILILDEIIKRYPNHPVVPFAWMAKGDCQFTLGNEDPDRYSESIRSYRVVTQKEGLLPGLRLQAEYKIGLSLQKLDRQQDALDHYYTRVMLPFMERTEGSGQVSEAGAIWFSRAALNVADILESRQDWRQLVRVLDRVGQTGVAIAEQARRRSQAVRADNWWLFY